MRRTIPVMLSVLLSVLLGACVEVPPVDGGDGGGSGGAGGGAPVVDWRPDPALGSRCNEEVDRTGLSILKCVNVRREYWIDDVARSVYYQTPLGDAPPGGWPVVIVFQPSIYWADQHWTGFTTIAGQRHSTEIIKNLLDAGYVVLTPQAQALVNTVWETNIPLAPWHDDWTLSNDHLFLTQIFEDIENDVFGPIDEGAFFATGMSSGGYMTSRMALSYPGKFNALAIQSGAWATCLGPLDTNESETGLCTVPDPLPAGHPPTLFLHGGLDAVVPPYTMEQYYDALVAEGYTAEKIISPFAIHQFIAEAPGGILAWFDSFLPDHLQ